MSALLLFAAAGLAAGFAFIGNWLALRPWRKVRGCHWTEQARLYYPAGKAAATNMWAVPAAFVLASVLLEWDQMPHWSLVGLFGVLGTIVGSIPMSREVFPRIDSRTLLRLALQGWTIRLFGWAVLLAAAIAMPDQLNRDAALILCGAVLFVLLWGYDGWIRIGKWIGYIEPADEKLRSMALEVSVKLNVPVRQVLLIKAERAQAYALPATKTVMFTSRILEILTADELRVVCAHEYGHLAESRAVILFRHLRLFQFLPFILSKPLVLSFGSVGFVIPIVTMLAVQQIMARASHWLEKRADKVAVETETERGVYARALAKLYEDALVPAVLQKGQTHPNLYDRMIAVGITPDFPKPKPAETTAANGWLVAALVGILAVMLLARIVDQHHGMF